MHRRVTTILVKFSSLFKILKGVEAKGVSDDVELGVVPFKKPLNATQKRSESDQRSKARRRANATSSKRGNSEE